MERHLDRCLGRRQRRVFHELVSPIVHLDVHVIAPSDRYPCWRLVTCGMAEKPMVTPPGFKYSPYAELTIALPPELKLRELRWAVELLYDMARSTHRAGSYLWDGHTVSWTEPIAPGTSYASAIVVPPSNAPEGFDEFKCRENTVNILAVLPLHQDELELCLNEGAGALCDRLDAAGVTDVVDPARASVA
jgi:hypothetical protein